MPSGPKLSGGSNRSVMSTCGSNRSSMQSMSKNSFPSDLEGLDSGSLRDAVGGMPSLDRLKEEAMDFDDQLPVYGEI